MGNRRKLRKIVMWLLVLLLSAAILYVLEGCPSFTAEMAFRRKEKQNMIGPAEFISTIDFPHGRYDHMMIGKSEYGYTFFEWDDGTGWDNGILSYILKQEGATLYCTYWPYGSSQYSSDWLPIFAFADVPAAVSARLTLKTTQEGETVTYPLSATKSKDGYYLFSWKILTLRANDYRLVQQLITGKYSDYVLEGTAQAVLELYNAKGELVGTYHFDK